MREAGENGVEMMRGKADRVLRKTGLTSPLKFSVTEKHTLSEEERQRLDKLFLAKNLLAIMLTKTLFDNFVEPFG